MADILSTITTVLASIVNWVSSIITVITAEGNELILLFVILPVALIAIGVVKRLIRL